MKSEDIIKLLDMQPIPEAKWSGEHTRYEWSEFHGEVRPAVYIYIFEDRKRARRMLDEGCTDLDEIARVCGDWAMKI